MQQRTISFKVDEEKHKEIKIRIAKKGQNLKDYIMELIEKDLKTAENEKK